MKADPTGSPSEQAFARMGWQPVKEAKALGMQPCSTCHFFVFALVQDGWGGVVAKARCKHVDTFGTKSGQATRENASCNRWEKKHV